MLWNQQTMFESSVISYGNQTCGSNEHRYHKFESSVISYGNQTVLNLTTPFTAFESSVISYGNQTRHDRWSAEAGLRVV